MFDHATRSLNTLQNILGSCVSRDESAPGASLSPFEPHLSNRHGGRRIVGRQREVVIELLLVPRVRKVVALRRRRRHVRPPRRRAPRPLLGARHAIHVWARLPRHDVDAAAGGGDALLGLFGVEHGLAAHANHGVARAEAGGPRRRGARDLREDGRRVARPVAEPHAELALLVLAQRVGRRVARHDQLHLACRVLQPARQLLGAVRHQLAVDGEEPVPGVEPSDAAAVEEAGDDGADARGWVRAEELLRLVLHDADLAVVRHEPHGHSAIRSLAEGALRNRRSAQDGVAERQHDVAREEADGARLLASHLEHRHAGQARRGAEVDAPRARELRPDHEDEAVPSPEVGASHVGRGDVLDRVDPEAPLLGRRGLEEVRARPRARSHLESEPGLRAAPLLGTERDGRAAQVRDAAVGRARVWTGIAPAELAFAARPELDPAKLKDGAHLVRLV
mmetsp:Transcript_34615/g.114666  ORF Transcript_34615/g.114666 Transcript_34615/m.114666 type:complete len:450 (+) Transcript_34615:103-1452(+)